MRNPIIVAAVLAFAMGGAIAQAQTPPAQNSPQNGAINSSDKQVGAPVKGSNSFTEGEARSRIEAKGFTNVGQLKKDDNGIWRGQATHNGQQTQVSLDYQGNVFGGDAGAGNTAPTGAATSGNAGR